MNRLVLIVTALVMGAMAAGGRNPRPAPDVPATSVILSGYDDPDSVRARMAASPLHIVEGLWRFPADGGLMAVERCDISGAGDGASQYRLVVVDAANRILSPGTVMGYLWATSKRGVYEARLYTSVNSEGTSLGSPKYFTLTLDDQESRLSFRKHKTGVRLNLWRLLPFMFRFSVVRQDNRPDDLDGCVREYPMPALPAEPIYL